MQKSNGQMRFSHFDLTSVRKVINFLSPDFTPKKNRPKKNARYKKCIGHLISYEFCISIIFLALSISMTSISDRYSICSKVINRLTSQLTSRPSSSYPKDK